MRIKQRLTYNSKEICLAPRNVQSNQNFAFIKAIAESLLSLQLSFACYPAFYLIWKKGDEDIYHSALHALMTVIRFAWFQQYWLLLRYNSDLVKLEWTSLLLLTSTKSNICQIDAKYVEYPVAEYFSFSHQASTLKTDQLQVNINFF